MSHLSERTTTKSGDWETLLTKWCPVKYLTSLTFPLIPHKQIIYLHLFGLFVFIIPFSRLNKNCCCSIIILMNYINKQPVSHKQLLFLLNTNTWQKAKTLQISDATWLQCVGSCALMALLTTDHSSSEWTVIWAEKEG